MEQISDTEAVRLMAVFKAAGSELLKLAAKRSKSIEAIKRCGDVIDQLLSDMHPEYLLAIRRGMQKIPPNGCKKRHVRLPSEVTAMDRLRCLRRQLRTVEARAEDDLWHNGNLCKAISVELSPDTLKEHRAENAA